MASRREQLEAYTFARRRMVAGFLQPEPGGGAEEKAPKPFRALVPGIVIGALILTGFGVYGLVRPGVPPGWKNKGSLIVGRDSASRYVYIDGKLHPVLNIASGRLLLDPGKFKVNLVPEKVINKEVRGAPLGIPTAPDRLPTAKDVRKAKSWTVCERPAVTAGNRPDLTVAPQRSLFLGVRPEFGELTGDQALYVSQQWPAPKPEEGTGWFIVQDGRKYPVNNELVRNALALDVVQPQPVSKEWLDTLEPGTELDFPVVDGYGERTTANIPDEYGVVGTVLKAQDSDRFYLVTRDAVAPVSRLVATLIRSRPDARVKVYKDRPAVAFPVAVSDLGDTIRAGALWGADKAWPELVPQAVNRVELDVGEGRTTLCNTYTGTYAGGVPQIRQSAWTAPPRELVPGTGDVYVEPGAGAVVREVTGGADDRTGPIFLVTDSGLRYHIVNDPPSGGGAKPPEEDSEAKIRLGYQGVEPTPVPRSWTTLMPVGVRLSTADAEKPQIS
ncbi:type VII secretion protein EccB [Yinghuangia sp. ASG 101]|uniref:type VII secretion protein EccB n=1 Tax=Yinghuangia sp. ASG 101 TaxID=2896848 RepID=UPI001E561DBE|nr:type VII secretion protein EccB [Yinghuangia sp. ASG 101]UGQ09905.1 type VII secretion protein EccB [Yinghuangia sp. ASG 101]